MNNYADKLLESNLITKLSRIKLNLMYNKYSSYK